MFEYRKITKRFPQRTVFSDFSLTIGDKEVTYIIGASGTGKSVLMKLGLGLLPLDSGNILIDGQDVTHLTEQQWRPIRQKNVLVFQHSTLFDSLTIRENVALPLQRHSKISRNEAMQEAVQYLELVQMAHCADCMPQELGPSEHKRAAIARALSLSPQCTILDEPTTGLDALAASNVDELIVHLAKGLNKTVIVVSHDIRSTLTIADRIVFLYKGLVHLDGSPSAFRASRDPVVQQFISGNPVGPMET